MYICRLGWLHELSELPCNDVDQTLSYETLPKGECLGLYEHIITHYPVGRNLRKDMHRKE